MKKLIKIAVCLISFCAALFLMSMIFNMGNTDMTADMQPASYPLIYMEMDGHKLNCLHGCTNDLQLPYLKESITPLVEGRGISVSIDTFGREVSSIVYEIRNLSGDRLVEQTELLNYVEHADEIDATFSIKNLIDENREYHMIFLLTMEDGSVIKYYTRIIQAYDYKAEEKLAFVYDFSEKTFLRDETSQELATYLESDANGDNSTYNAVDIHSSYEQITWGDLDITRETPPVATIFEIAPQTASITLDYLVNVKDGRKDDFYQVKEKYRIRQGSDRMYLLEYERSMDKLMFNIGNLVFGNKMMLGIVDEDMDFTENESGNNLAFVNAGSLYSYSIVNSSFATVFSFYNEEHFDNRTLYQNHDIKILNIDETGNIFFLVYGYMNRGKYEGQVGMTLYFYDAVVNDTQEMLFIPYYSSTALLRANVEQLSYLNKDQVFYVYLDGTVYSINMKENTTNTVVDGLTEQTSKVSADNEMLAWISGDSPYDCRELILMNLNTGEKTNINAPQDGRIMPLGFVQNDLIYGLAQKQDIFIDVGGATIFPMYNVRIRNNSGSILKNYEQAGYYVTKCLIDDQMISMERMEKDEEDGTFMEASGDTILNNKIIYESKNVVETVVTQNKKKIVQIALNTNDETKNVKGLQPREVLYEGNKTLDLQGEQAENKKYYVYSFGNIEGIFREPAGAINLAYELSGTVVGDKGDYIWIKGNRSVKNQIMAITATKRSDTRGTLAVCLDTMLGYAGITRNAQPLIDNGKTTGTILRTSMPDAQVLDLQGCSLDAVLYYVNRDLPVLVQMDNHSAMLVIGFNELNTVVMDPELGTIYKIGKNDSEELFKENGNRFYTYIPNESQ